MLADLETHHIEGVARHGAKPFAVPLISHIVGNLYVGGCIDGVPLPEGIEHVVSLYSAERYRLHAGVKTALTVQMLDAAEEPDETLVWTVAWHAHPLLRSRADARPLSGGSEPLEPDRRCGADPVRQDRRRGDHAAPRETFARRALQRNLRGVASQPRLADNGGFLMDPVDHARCNFTFLGPTSDIADLRVELIDGGPDKIDHVASYWRPTADELADLNAGGLVRLGVWAFPIPPFSLAVEPVEPTRSATAIDVVVRGKELTIDPSSTPVDVADLLAAALPAAGWEGGAWEIRNADGMRLGTRAPIAGHPQPFYIDPPAGTGA